MAFFGPSRMYFTSSGAIITQLPVKVNASKARRSRGRFCTGSLSCGFSPVLPSCGSQYHCSNSSAIRLSLDFASSRRETPVSLGNRRGLGFLTSGLSWSKGVFWVSSCNLKPRWPQAARPSFFSRSTDKLRARTWATLRFRLALAWKLTLVSVHGPILNVLSEIKKHTCTKLFSCHISVSRVWQPVLQILLCLRTRLGSHLGE